MFKKLTSISPDENFACSSMRVTSFPAPGLPFIVTYKCKVEL